VGTERIDLNLEGRFAAWLILPGRRAFAVDERGELCRPGEVDVDKIPPLEALADPVERVAVELFGASISGSEPGRAVQLASTTAPTSSAVMRKRRTTSSDERQLSGDETTISGTPWKLSILPVAQIVALA
jgi:hypothetical protein